MLTKQRKELYDFCCGRQCCDCPVDSQNPNHRCGNGTLFLKKVNGSYEMSDEEIIASYRLAFGKDISNPVTHPSHYTQGNIQCIDAMQAAFGKEAVATWCKINAFKYIWREEHKNGMEDIDKAVWYLNKFKELKASGE